MTKEKKKGLRKKQEKSEIAYQNKDIMSKLFGEKFPNVSLRVYGVNTPKIIRVLPTNLPKLKVNELRIDNLFFMEDGSYAIIDYESKYTRKNKVKYLGYVANILQRYIDEPDFRLRLIIIYTADVTRAQTESLFDIGAVKIEMQQAFLSELDSDKIKERLTNKIRNQEEFTEEELMEYIILPLSYKGREKKKETIRELFELSKKIENEETQVFLVAGMIAFADKVVDVQTAKEMKEWISMTKVAKLFEEEKNEAIKQAIRAKDEELQSKDNELQSKDEELQSKDNKLKSKVRKMLENGEPVEKIYLYFPEVADEVLGEEGVYSGRQGAKSEG